MPSVPGGVRIPVPRSLIVLLALAGLLAALPAAADAVPNCPAPGSSAKAKQA